MQLAVYIHGSSGFSPKETIDDYLSLATHYDSIGVHSLWFADHLIRTPDPNKTALFEAWSLIAGLSRETTDIKFGTMVTPITFRKFGPFVKQLVTVDHLSGGRIIAGLGAGWSYKEYDLFGVDFPSTKDRLDTLEETVQALQMLWSSDDSVDFDGQHVQLQQAYLKPQPVNGRIPILIGGGGERRTLRQVAKYADYSNFGGDLATIEHKLSVLAGHCDQVGRSFDAITPTSNRAIILGKTDAEVEEGITKYLARFKELGHQPPSRDDFATTRLVGTIDEVVSQLGQLEDLGIQLPVLTVNDSRTTELLGDLIDAV